MAKTRVEVKIFGQDYTITGDSTSNEIAQIAEYVDSKTKFIGKITNEVSQSRIAILSAINITEEYFAALQKVKEVEKEKKDLENEVQNCLKKLEAQKEDFMSYQKEVMKANDEKKDSDEKYEQLEKKISEVESSYFDLQMENIKLKSQIKKMEMNNLE